jgi:hypothetical protein
VLLGIALSAQAILAEAPSAVSQSDDQAGASLEAQFRDPPNVARPRVWWHWLNGNVTEQGITKDLDWMQRVGIGGLQNFDINLSTPVMVEKRLAYMTPEWKAAFRFAAEQADKRGLELAIAASPGWSETGGPWVQPQDGLKKLVWTEAVVTGGKPISAKLAAPSDVAGPFQDMPAQDAIPELGGGTARVPPRFYRDIAVLAVPDGSTALASPVVTDGAGRLLDGAALFDASLNTSLALPRGTAEAPAAFVVTYPNAVTVRSATLLVHGAKGLFSGVTLMPRLEISEDGKSWQPLAAIPVTEVPTTISFAPVTARMFRVVLPPAPPPPPGDPAPGIVPPPFVTSLIAAAQAPLQIGKFSLSGEVRVDRFESKAGFALERNYFALDQSDRDAPAIALTDVVDLTDKLRDDGTLNWTPPKGSWRVIRIGASLLGTTNHPAPEEATGLEVDKFDGAAVATYLNHYIGMYRDAVGDDLLGQRGVRAILTDSIEVGAANWTPKMLEQFRILRGYDPRPWMPVLTGVVVGSRDQSDKFLYDWRRTLSDLIASQHYGTIARIAHERGLKVYGEALENGRPSLGDDMAMRSHADVPMAAMWTFASQAGPMPSFVADIKGAASVAHLYGQNVVAAESMTSALAYWAYSPRDLRRIIDLEFVTGVNRPVIHTSVHSPMDDKEPGLSLMIFGQHFNRHETWAELAKPWMDYMARSALLLQRGRYVADVAYFYGEEAPLTGLYGERQVGDAPRTNAYDFVNSDALMNLLTNDGPDIVAPSGARYRALFLGGSSDHMTLGTLQRIAALVQGGATIVGKPPKTSPSLMGSNQNDEWQTLVSRLWYGSGDTRIGNGRVIAGNDIEAALRTMGVLPDFSFVGSPGDDVPFVHRRDGDGDYYFLVNRNSRATNGEARFRVSGKAPELWHADTGVSEPIGYRVEGDITVVPIALAAEESVFVVFRKPATRPALKVLQPVLTPVGVLDMGWSVQFQPGRGAPARATFAKLAPLDENSAPGIRFFSGIVTYSRKFTAPRGWKPGRPLWVDLGEVGDLAQVSVNGEDVGTVWHAPYRVNVANAAKPGGNLLIVRVANLWVNRLIGDAQAGAAQVTWTAIPTYMKEAPLRRSGLIGPVTLLSSGYTAHR